MKETIDRIRALLDELERNSPATESERVLREFSAFEMPEIVKDIVDHLVPLPTPYEAVIYWHIFRHAILETGEQYVRVSTRSLLKGIVKSAYEKTGWDNPDRSISYQTVKKIACGA